MPWPHGETNPNLSSPRDKTDPSKTDPRVTAKRLSFTATAMSTSHSKVILLGEHAVVYGLPALAVGIERGARARARKASEPELTIGERSSRDDSELDRGFRALLAALDAPPVQIHVELEVPPGAGLGASAAIAIASARAILELLERPMDNAAVMAAAEAWERVFHGNPSGIDTAAAALGGCILFCKGTDPEPVPLMRPLTLAIGQAGPAASTKTMVEGVARLKARRPEMVEKALNGIEALVKNAKLCLQSGDLDGLGKLMDFNQMLLSGLFVSTEPIERACAVAREHGALGAKLTGAGGGGCVIALLDGSAGRVLEAWRAEGFECFATRVCAPSGSEALEEPNP